MKIIDLTVPLNEKLQCYPTDPPFKRSWHVEYDKEGSNLSRLDMGAHAGTHVDAPLHFLRNGISLTEMSVEIFLGNAIAIDSPKSSGENVMPEDLSGADVRAGDIVLFHTGWEKRASSPMFFEGEWPGIDPATIDILISKKVKGIGGDIASADSPMAIAAGAAAHKKAAEAGIPIYEALINMDKVIGKRFFFIALPLKLEGGEASPVRAIAILDFEIA